MPITPRANGVRLSVRLTPKASKNRIGAVERSADGSVHLKVYVTTVPEGGKANKTLLKMLAKSSKIPASKFSVASGATNRNKQLLIEGETRELTQKLQQWIKESFP